MAAMFVLLFGLSACATATRGAASSARVWLPKAFEDGAVSQSWDRFDTGSLNAAGYSLSIDGCEARIRGRVSHLSTGHGAAGETIQYTMRLAQVGAQGVDSTLEIRGLDARNAIAGTVQPPNNTATRVSRDDALRARLNAASPAFATGLNPSDSSFSDRRQAFDVPVVRIQARSPAVSAHLAAGLNELSSACRVNQGR
jgi:hypothetical protein